MPDPIIIDVWEANFKLDEQRRVIEEVARRCRLKGMEAACDGCPMVTMCHIETHLQNIEEEIKYASAN